MHYYYYHTNSKGDPLGSKRYQPQNQTSGTTLRKNERKRTKQAKLPAYWHVFIKKIPHPWIKTNFFNNQFFSNPLQIVEE